MAFRITYSKTALQDLTDIYNYISLDLIRFAKREILLIQAAVKKLKLAPLIGRRFEKSKDEFTRELIFRKYRIVYEFVSEKYTNILSIHHHSRLIANNPAFKDEE